MAITKNFEIISKKFDSTINYSVDEAVDKAKDLKFSNFDESLDIAVCLGVDPRHADQNIRVSTTLPHGTGKSVRVLVIAEGEKQNEAKDAGADFVGKEFLSKLKEGWSDVEKIVATPDMMPELGKLGKILGPKGLMPNPKSGTVTLDVGKAVKSLKAGQIELRVEKNGIVHAQCGKLSFEKKMLVENIMTIYDALLKSKPSSVKGTYIKNMSISSTMGPGIKLNINNFQ
jgi:large subunit ribosomal protein L1